MEKGWFHHVSGVKNRRMFELSGIELSDGFIRVFLKMVHVEFSSR